MSQISTNEFKGGVKIEIEAQPYVIISNEFVKPGKGQAFNRVRLKNLLNGRTIDRTFKSGDKVDLADVVEASMRMLYKSGRDFVFMDDDTFEQLTIDEERIGQCEQWMKEDLLYSIILYKGETVSIEPPIFMELKVTQTDPGIRGDTATGRVMKPAELETGAKIQIPIFVEEGEIIKVDTRTSEYVSRAQ